MISIVRAFFGNPDRSLGRVPVSNYVEYLESNLHDTEAAMIARCYVEPGLSKAEVLGLYDRITEMADSPEIWLEQKSAFRKGMPLPDCASAYADKGSAPAVGTGSAPTLEFDDFPPEVAAAANRVLAETTAQARQTGGDPDELLEMRIDRLRNEAAGMMDAGSGEAMARYAVSTALLVHLIDRARREFPWALPQYQLALGEDLLAQRDYAGAEHATLEALKLLLQEKVPDAAAATRAKAILRRIYEESENWAGLEHFLRRNLQTAVLIAGPRSSEGVAASLDLAEHLQKMQRHAEAIALAAPAAQLSRELLGPAHPLTVRGADVVKASPDPKPGVVLSNLTDDAETLPSEGMAYSGLDNGFDYFEGPLATRIDRAIDKLNNAATQDGRLAAQLEYTLLLEDTTIEGRKPRQLVEEYQVLARLYDSSGRLADGELAWRKALELAVKQRGAGSRPTAAPLLGLGRNLMRQLRHAEAQEVLLRGKAIIAPSVGTRIPERALAYFDAVADALEAQGLWAEAEPVRRDILFRYSAGSAARSGVALASNLVAQGKIAEAREIQMASAGQDYFVEIEAEQEEGDVLDSLAKLLLVFDEPIAARRMARQRRLLLEERFGNSSPQASRSAVTEALALLELGEGEMAISLLRPACNVLASYSNDGLPDEVKEARLESVRCASMLTGALGANISENRFEETFLAYQQAQLSDAANALSEATARSAARASDLGILVNRQDELNRQLYALQAKRPSPSERLDLAADLEFAEARAKVRAELSDLAGAIQRQFPRYAALRYPRPVGLTELQTHGAGSRTLLRGNEALVCVFVPDSGSVLVFAISHTDFAVVRTPLTAAQLSSKVLELRQGLDPQGGTGARVDTMDRTVAYELYLDLLGAPAIQRVIGPADTLLFVPDGALESLPISVLVTMPPAGLSLNDTAWLVKSKAIAVIPSVASLRLLRLTSEPKRTNKDELQVFADPAFDGKPDPEPVSGPFPRVGGFANYFRDGSVVISNVSQLPRLPGTRSEAEYLARIFSAPPANIHTGLNASEAMVKSLNANGQLGRATVISFATHGLVAGGFKDLAEPGIALALPEPGAGGDGFLTASEAAELDLSTDWLVLSACNTASPDGVGAQGLSGLSRSFFYAGASALLVSNWSVSDFPTAELMDRIFRNRVSQPNKAKALQEAMLSVMTDPEIEGASDPATWGAFMVVGVPD